jgi:uncharacterized protein
MSQQSTPRSEVPLWRVPQNGVKVPAVATSSRPPPAVDPGRERIVIRPLGTPLPLAFVGLAVATSMLACLNLGWIPVGEQHQVALVLVAFAFPLQGLAAVFCFLARDAPTGSGIGVQASAWLTLGLLLLTGVPGVRSDTTAIFLFVAAAALIPAAFSAALGKLVPALVIAATALRFVLTGIYEHVGTPSWAHAAGWEGIALACLALYAALATDLESARHKSLLPLGRRNAGQAALDPRVGPSANRLSTEPGVRDQL